jgi:hypothetical protein
MTLTTRRELVFETATDRVFDALTTLDGLAGVVWTCPTNTGHPEWEGTTIAFDLRPTDCDAGVLSFRHLGLIPSLSCYERRESGWEHFLSSLLNYDERGKGSPFR